MVRIGATFFKAKIHYILPSADIYVFRMMPCKFSKQDYSVGFVLEAHYFLCMNFCAFSDQCSCPIQVKRRSSANSVGIIIVVHFTPLTRM
jgi:hypothetical protein